jgi:hypothetical protein
VFQLRHSAHCPTHFGVVHPHSEQRYVEWVRAMRGTLPAGTDMGGRVAVGHGGLGQDRTGGFIHARAGAPLIELKGVVLILKPPFAGPVFATAGRCQMTADAHSLIVLYHKRPGFSDQQC